VSTEPKTHPSADELSAFGLGKLNERQAQTVERHIEHCEACRKHVIAAPADSFLGLVRSAKPAAPPPADALSPPPTSASLFVGQPAAPIPQDLPPELAEHPKFKIVRQLGQGGMGVVYLAQHRVMDRTVAIKVISKSVLDNPEALARFQGEVRAAARLQHPNIVTAHDAEQAGTCQMLVMEYVKGIDLGKVLQKKGTLSVIHACNYIRQAALGLQHAFEQGMVHRDIKPQNLMLTPEGRIKILDFGLARLVKERKRGPGLTQDGAFMGTPEYVAPEQAGDAHSVDIRADVYSLGCTLYCLLTGRPPFVHENYVRVAMMHVTDEPPSLKEARPDAPETLVDIVRRMLAKNPADRFQTPAEVAAALLPFARSNLRAAAGEPANGEKPPALKDRPTRMPGDTSRTQRRDEREENLVFTDRGDERQPATSIESRKSPRLASSLPGRRTATRTKWLVRAGMGTCVAIIGVLGLSMTGVFKVKTAVKTADRTIAPKDLPSDADVMPSPQVAGAKQQDGSDATPKDILQKGSVWRGVGGYTDRALPGQPEGKFLCTLRITERTGDGFKGVYEFENGASLASTVEGNIGGPVKDTSKRKIRWEGVEDIKGRAETRYPTTMEGTLEGSVIVVAFSHQDGSGGRPIGSGIIEFQARIRDGFVPLFNGKDLSGWDPNPDLADRFAFEHGDLIWRKGGYLWTERNDYKDFHLRVEARIGHRVYGQLIVRDGFGQATEKHWGHAVVINSDNENSDKTGSLVVVGKGSVITIRESPVPPNRWFQLEVIVLGNHIVVKVNGQTKADYQVPDDPRFARGRITVLTMPPEREPGHYLELRNFEIKELPVAKPETDASQRP
jgi:serine/threonine protein kinase